MTTLKDLGKNPGRLDIHKALGTYHFDKTSDKVDYEYFGRIEMPNEWWDDGLQEILNRQTPVAVTTGAIFATVDNAQSDIGQMALATDYRNSQHPVTDVLFDRYLIEEGSVFNDINNYFQITNPVIRIADQGPTECVGLHIDHEHTQVLQSKAQHSIEHTMDIEASCGSRGNAKKFMVAMHDFDPEIVLGWGNTTVPTLKRGDVISWKYGVPHWTINFSTQHRYVLGIIGTIDKQYYLDKFNFDYADTDSYPTPVYEAV